MSSAHQRARDVVEQYGDNPETHPRLVNIIAAALGEEIEACAKVAEAHPMAAIIRMSTGESIATAIRQRKGAR